MPRNIRHIWSPPRETHHAQHSILTAVHRPSRKLLPPNGARRQRGRRGAVGGFLAHRGGEAGERHAHPAAHPPPHRGSEGEARGRSEARRREKECVSTCRSRWSPYH